jgi:hypothetical protein
VLNPSFEQVSGSSSAAQSGYFSIMAQGATGWAMKQTAATSGVPFWTGTNVYPDQGYPRVLVISNGAYLGQTTSHGTKFALVPGWLGTRPQEIVGTLATATNPGTTYVLSADIAKIGMAYSPTVQLWLRNSGTGAQSAAVVQPPGALSINWRRATGTVTANVSYDQVVVRYQEVPHDFWQNFVLGNSTWLGLADDLRVCRAATALDAAPAGWWTTSRVVGGSILGAVVVGALGWHVRRRSGTKGR